MNNILLNKQLLFKSIYNNSFNHIYNSNSKISCIYYLRDHLISRDYFTSNKQCFSNNNNNFVNGVSFTVKPASQDTKSTVLKMMQDLEDGRNKKKQQPIKKVNNDNTTDDKLKKRQNRENQEVLFDNNADLNEYDDEYDDDEEIGLVDNEGYDDEYEAVESVNRDVYRQEVDDLDESLLDNSNSKNNKNSKKKQQSKPQQQNEIDEDEESYQDDDGVYLFDENQDLQDVEEHDKQYDEYGMEGMEDYEFDDDINEDEQLEVEKLDKELLSLVAQSEQTTTSNKPTRAEIKEQHKNLEKIIKSKYGDKANSILNKIMIQEKYGNWEPKKKLTRDQMDEVKKLHKEDPDIYTLEVLANQFKVSQEAIKRIIRSKWTPSEDRLLEQDSQKKTQVKSKKLMKHLNNQNNNSDNNNNNNNKEFNRTKKNNNISLQNLKSNPNPTPKSTQSIKKNTTNYKSREKPMYDKDNDSKKQTTYIKPIVKVYTSKSLEDKMKRINQLSSKVNQK